MTRYRKVPGLSVIAQDILLRREFPGFTRKTRSDTLAVWDGPLQIAESGRAYTVSIQLRPGESPRVRVVSPCPLPLHPGEKCLPHIYYGGYLCLYEGSRQWNPSRPVTDIVCWTSEWLAFYEIWLVTGNWKGGGRHPESPPARRIRRARKSKASRRKDIAVL